MNTTAKQLGKQPAFAEMFFSENRAANETCPFEVETNSGMTKRELFAAMALQGLISCPMFNLKDDQREKNNTNPPLFFSETAVKYADALLEELSKV